MEVTITGITSQTAYSLAGAEELGGLRNFEKDESVLDSF